MFFLQNNTIRRNIPRFTIASVFFLLLSFLFTLPVGIKAETLNAGLEPWIPWIIKENGQYSGIVVEIAEEAFRRTGHTCEMVDIPVKRRDLLEWGRSIQVEPGCDKRWRVRQRDVSAYTAPYLKTRNVIVTRKGYYPVTDSLSTFYGTTVGANAGYFYTDGLNSFFEKGLIKRDDCGPGHLLISKLVKKRFHAIVADTIEWKYWMTLLGQDPSDFEESYSFSHSNDLRIRLHKDKAYLIPPLNQALESMQADGTIDAIVNQYLPE